MGGRVTSAASGLLTLTEVRERAAEALAPTPVLNAPVDALAPPAIMLAWAEPWLTFETPCFWNARLAVVCFAGRLEPDAGVATLESLVALVIGRLRADGYPWPHETTQAPRMVEIGGVPLLTARVIYVAPVTVGGS
jgi:hypothetical protein